MLKRYAPILLAGVLLGAAALALPQLVSAEDSPKSEPAAKSRIQDGARGNRGDWMLARMARHLNLTPDQQEQLKPILAERSERVRAVMQNPSLTREEKREQFKAVQEATRKQIAELLTEEQKQKLAQAGTRNPSRGRVMNGDWMIRHLTRSLDLTPEQQAQAKQIMEERFAKLQAVLQDQTLSREQKREKLQPIAAASRERLHAILTPEQKQKLEMMRQRMQDRARGAIKQEQPQGRS